MPTMAAMEPALFISKERPTPGRLYIVVKGIALDEALTAIQLGAIGLVIVALSVIVTSQRNPTPTPPPTAPLTSATTDSLSGGTKRASPPNP